MSAIPVVPLADAEFERVLVLVRRHTGINMDQGKRQLILGRLGRRFRVLGVRSFDEYCDRVECAGSAELEHFINAVTTNLTSFFREPGHFDHLKNDVVPDWVSTRPARRIRIWSAGCSTGCEPYSVAMTVASTLPQAAAWDWKILATDLDSNVVAIAKAGAYTTEQVEFVPEAYRSRWVRACPDRDTGQVSMADEIRSRIVFKRLNLMHSWPMKGQFDVIFCRNVAIYFDRPTQAKLFNRMADLLTDDGTLYIGHSESLFRVSDRLKLIGPTTYKKVP